MRYTYSSFKAGLSMGAEASMTNGFALVIARPLISIDVIVREYLLPDLQLLIVYNLSLGCNSIC